MEIGAHMVRHRLGAALIDRKDQLDDFLGLDITSEAIAPQRVSDLVEAFFGFFPGRLPGVLERRDIALEQIGDRARAGIRRNFDAASLLDHVREVALVDLARLGERHGGIGADLFLGPFAVTPLLRHPVGGDTFGHRLENKDETAGAAPFAVGEIFLLLTRLDPLQRMSNSRIGQAWHDISPVPQLGSVKEKRGSFAGSGMPFSTPLTPCTLR
eukprot:Opistho-2@40037